MATMLRRTKYRVPDVAPEQVHEVLQDALAPMETRPGFLSRLRERRPLDTILAALQRDKAADVPEALGIPEKCWVGETLPWKEGDEGFFGCYVRLDPGGVHLLLTYFIEAADNRSVEMELKWERHGVAASRTHARDLYARVGAWQRLLEDALRQAGFIPQKHSAH